MIRAVITIAFFLFAATACEKGGKSKPIPYCATLEEAMQKASRLHKPIFFNCYADWSGASVLMDSVVLKDAELSSFIRKHFVSLRVNMTKTLEGHELAKRYGVDFYAHYLVLDENGEVIHRIVGGSKAPAFKEKLAQSLNPNTSLAGMARRYNQGERSNEFLTAYAKCLSTAQEDEKYREVADYYLKHADTAELLAPQAWNILRKSGKLYGSEWFNFIYAHKAELSQANGPEVAEFIVQSAFQQIYPYMMNEKTYDGNRVSEIEGKIESLDTASASRGQLLDMCRILHLRQQKAYSQMLDVWEKMVPGLPAELRGRYDPTLGKLQDMEEKEKQRAAAYLRTQMEGLSESRLARYRRAEQELTKATKRMEKGVGNKENNTDINKL